MKIDIRPLNDPGKRRFLCQTIIATLPEWFAIPEYNVQYTQDAEIMDGLVATVDGQHVGLLVHKMSTDPDLEQPALNIHWIGVLPAFHGMGVGSALMLAVLDQARSRGLEILTVETLDPATEYENYLRTFRFYEKHGFRIFRYFIHDPEDPMVAMRRSV